VLKGRMVEDGCYKGRIVEDVCYKGEWLRMGLLGGGE